MKVALEGTVLDDKVRRGQHETTCLADVASSVEVVACCVPRVAAAPAKAAAVAAEFAAF